MRSTGGRGIQERCVRSINRIPVGSQLCGPLEDGWVRGGRTVLGPPSRFVFRADKGLHFAVGRG